MAKIDKIIKSKRRTIGLEITPDGKLTVHSPLNVSKAYISRIVEKEAGWITEKQESVRLRREKYPPKACRQGETFILLGKPLTLIFDKDTKILESKGQNLIVPERLRQNAQTAIVNWYKSEALSAIKKRADFYSEKTGIKFQTLKITGALTRWGSCSGKKICFSWRLAMAPLDMIDYVVVHELSHIKNPNHSSAFWRCVAAIMPDFEIRRNWFRENSALLRRDFFAVPN